VKLDAMVAADPLEAGSLAAGIEAAGYDGLWQAETQHDPYLALALAASATTMVSLGTAIATAFTRSPLVTAMAAWDLQRLSGGRFVLGLGTQVKAHNERRFSVPWSPPAPRLRELVEALRHIWGAFQGEHELSFRGRFYRHDLLSPAFDPGPIDHPRIPVYLAAVTPTMYRLAGEVADGVHVHPFHTVAYLREVALPALEQGLARGGRSRADVMLVAPVFAVLGDADLDVRAQVAFYGATSTYRPVLEAHGRAELTDTLRRLFAAGDPSAMAAAIDDDLLAEFAVHGTGWTEIAAALQDRYEGLLDRVGIYGLGRSGAPPSSELVRAFDAGS
jgi:probable F420-dependent oxidoreductase